MNPAHIHLIVNHLPVISVLFAIGFLAVGLFRKRDGLIMAGLVISLIVGLTAVPAYLSGEEAEDVVEQWPGVDHAFIHEHEEKAETAFYVAIVFGVLAAAVLIGGIWKPTIKKSGTWGVLVVALITAVLMAGTATSGGEIRHPEIRDSAQPPGASQGIIEDDD